MDGPRLDWNAAHGPPRLQRHMLNSQSWSDWLLCVGSHVPQQPAGTCVVAPSRGGRGTRPGSLPCASKTLRLCGWWGRGCWFVVLCVVVGLRCVRVGGAGGGVAFGCLVGVVFLGSWLCGVVVFRWCRVGVSVSCLFVPLLRRSVFVFVLLRALAPGSVQTARPAPLQRESLVAVPAPFGLRPQYRVGDHSGSGRSRSGMGRPGKPCPIYAASSVPGLLPLGRRVQPIWDGLA